MKTIFKNSDIPNDYCYLVPNQNYYDLYNTNQLEPNQNYNYYRVYYNLDEDFYTFNTRYNYNNYTDLQAIQVSFSDNYIYRKDYPSILNIVFIYFLFFLFFFNIFTSIIRRDGLLSHLF